MKYSAVNVISWGVTSMIGKPARLKKTVNIDLLAPSFGEFSEAFPGRVATKI
jgi:hypothetical protein